MHLRHRVWWACRQNLISGCLPGHYGATCGDNKTLCGCSACALPSGGFISCLALASWQPVMLEGLRSPSCSACLPAFPRRRHCRSLWQAASGSWNEQKTDIMEKIVFSWFSFLVQLAGGSEKHQGGAGQGLDHSSMGWGQCMQLGHRTRGWHWLGTSCTSDWSQCFILLTGHRHHLSTGYKYKLVADVHLCWVNCALE